MYARTETKGGRTPFMPKDEFPAQWGELGQAGEALVFLWRRSALTPRVRSLNRYGTSDANSVAKGDAYGYFTSTDPANFRAGCGRACSSRAFYRSNSSLQTPSIDPVARMGFVRGSQDLNKNISTKGFTRGCEQWPHYRSSIISSVNRRDDTGRIK